MDPTDPHIPEPTKPADAPPTAAFVAPPEPPVRTYRERGPDVNDSMIAWIIFVCSLVFMVYVCTAGLNLSGMSIEGVSISGANRLIDSPRSMMYRDFYAPYGPGRYYALATAFSVVNQFPPYHADVLTARHFWSLLTAGTALMLYLLCRHWMSPLPACLAAAVFVLLHPPMAEIYLPLSITLVALLIAADRHDGSYRRALGVGAMIGVAFLFRELAGAATLVGALVTYGFRALVAPLRKNNSIDRLYSPWLKLPAVLIGAGLPISLMALCFVAFSAHFPTLVDNTLQSIQLRHSLAHTILPNPFAAETAGAGIERAIFYAPPVVYLFTVILIFKQFVRRQRVRGDAEALGLSAMGAVAYLAFLDRGTGDALLVVGLPAGVLVCQGVAILIQRTAQILRGEDPRRRLAHAAAYSVLVLAAFAAVETFAMQHLFVNENGYMRLLRTRDGYEINYKGTTLRVTMADKRRFSVVQSFFMKELNEPIAQSVETLDLGSENRQPEPSPQEIVLPYGTTLYCIPAGGIWYSYLVSINPTQYTMTTGFSEKHQRQLIRRLDGQKVDYILYDTKAFQRKGNRSFAKTFPLVHDYIFTYYEKVEESWGILILKRKPGVPMYPPIEPKDPKLFAGVRNDRSPSPRGGRLPAVGPAQAAS